MNDPELYGALAAAMVRDTVDRFADQPRTAASGNLLRAVPEAASARFIPRLGSSRRATCFIGWVLRKHWTRMAPHHG